MKNINLIELNEINFEIVTKYLEKYPARFKGFEKLKKMHEINTVSEDVYELIEPWIQWVSVHTLKNFNEHQVLRLGDIVNFSGDQIFELVERQGYKVGCISPMNTKNNLKNPAYFVPDPWTETHADNSLLSRNLHQALRQAVNDNSEGKVKVTTYLILAWIILSKTRKKNWGTYLKLFQNRKKRWNKALFLDLVLSDIFVSLKKRNNENFSCLFLNAFAHIQHHYMLSSEMYSGELANDIEYIDVDDDPFIDAIEIYDLIIFDLLTEFNQKFIFATGLRQVPVHDQIIYYRLRNHDQFLSKLGLMNFQVIPRMTRDFLLKFSDKKDLIKAYKILQSTSYNEVKLFEQIEQRENSLFVTLTYSKQLSDESILKSRNIDIHLKDEFVFVAIKNGRHDGLGYVFLNYEAHILKDNDHVSEIGHEILHYFKA